MAFPRSADNFWRKLATDERAMKVLAAVLLLLITIPMLTKVFTSDFGTHIALGREIVRTLSIPDKEFLNYPSLGRFNQNAEWGFQALLYLVFSAFGIYGVSFLCWAVVAGIYFFIHRATVLRGANPILTVLAIFAFSGFLRIRIQPRPEIFTYLFTAITIYIFTEYYFGKRKKIVYAFPLLVVLWANMHPTYLMAFVLCGAFFADALIRAAWNREFQWARLRAWIIPTAVAGLAGLAACGLNPKGFEAILAPLHVISRGQAGGAGGGASVLMSISELTPVKGTGMFVYYKTAAVFAAASLLLGAVGRRIYLLDLMLFAIAFKGSWDSARAVSMMGLFLSPGAALHLTGFLQRLGGGGAPVEAGTAGGRPAKEPPAKKGGESGKGKEKRGEGARGAAKAKPRAGRSWGRIAAAAALCAALLALGGVTLSFSMAQLEYGVGLTEHKFSLKAGEFLRANPIKGNMFNFFDIGGFLDWQLYPQALTFIDGRTYNQQVFMEHQMVTGALPGWENVLRRYDVTYIVIKTMDSSGSILPLVEKLSSDPSWELVFSDGLFVVLAKNIPQNAEIIRRFGIPKSALPQQIIWEAYHYMYLGVSPVLAYHTMSNMYQIMGNLPAAIDSLRKALEYSDEPFIRDQLMRMEQSYGARQGRR